MRKFSTQVEYIKYRVLKEVSSHAWHDQLFENLLNIPKDINPTKKPISRCCVYKEHVILSERVKLAIGGQYKHKHIVNVIDVACDECPVGGYEVSNRCRGCLAHKCQAVCPKDAISLDANNHAVIDKSKCIECGLCAKACPYNAISNYERPCVGACEVDAISMDENHVAMIDYNKCVSCGACVTQCPFGAIMDKSFIINVIDMIKRKSSQSKIYAMVAPSIASQYHHLPIEKVVGGLMALGFDRVFEAALGADLVAQAETEELLEKQLLTSSCCPAFVSLIEKHFPEVLKHMSHNLSPMALLGKKLKEKDPEVKVVFIGPCIAKKGESLKEDVKPYIDAVITFEELDALFDSKNINLETCESVSLDDASYHGRIFARSGGLIEAIRAGVDELGDSEFKLQPSSCNGLKECKKVLFKLSKNLPVGNFIEGMACVGGCIGGPSSISHSPKDSMKVNQFSKTSNKSLMSASL